jgi:UDP-N-acetylmuramyl pentapeptide phosphotransferase/UDP-N-acetylglucosamine-1-phosphate transferase
MDRAHRRKTRDGRRCGSGDVTGTDEQATILAIMAVLSAGVLSAAATGIALRVLRQRAILDRPNERSSHTVPTPRGGGWGLLAGLLPAWVTIAAVFCTLEAATLAPVVGVAFLAVVSWIDDRRGLPARVRLVVQILAAAGALVLLPEGANVTGGIVPLWLERTLCLFAWVWFMNLYNFMDGIDGIAGAQAIAVGIGIAAVFGLVGLWGTLAWQGLAVAAAAAGFLVWNWHPARLFMGDVGSVPLGYLLGWLLLGLAMSGAWAAAVILPLVFVADATTTLARRAWRREKVWQAHREHAYQRAVQRGIPHDRVVIVLSVANTGLVALALASTAGPVAGAGALVAGAALTLMLLRRLGGPASWRRGEAQPRP